MWLTTAANVPPCGYAPPPLTVSGKVDYYQAMCRIEEVREQPASSIKLLVLLDALESEVLDEKQQQAVQALRAVILVLDFSTESGRESDGSVTQVL